MEKQVNGLRLGSAAWIALVSVSCLLSGCGSGPQPDEAEVIAEGFLAQISAGNVDEAWEATSSEFKSFMGRDRLRNFVRGAPSLKQPVTLVRCQPKALETGLELIECVYSPEKGDKTIRILLDSQQGKWVVERLYVD